MFGMFYDFCHSHNNFLISFRRTKEKPKKNFNKENSKSKEFEPKV